MGVFNDIPIGWRDREYIIPANRVLKVIAAIEEHITIDEICSYASRGAMLPITKITFAYGAALRLAGAAVSDDEVYEHMFSGDEERSVALDALNGLLGMMMPASKLAEFQAGLEKTEAGATKPGNSRRAGARSSKRSTRRSPART